MSPKIKSVLSTIATFTILFTVIVYKFIPSILAFFATTIGILFALVLFLILPYLVYKIFLKIYS